MDVKTEYFSEAEEEKIRKGDIGFIEIHGQIIKRQTCNGSVILSQAHLLNPKP